MAAKLYRARRDLRCRTTAIGLQGSVHLVAGQTAELEDAVAEYIIANNPENPAIELVEAEKDKTPKKGKKE